MRPTQSQAFVKVEQAYGVGCRWSEAGGDDLQADAVSCGEGGLPAPKTSSKTVALASRVAFRTVWAAAAPPCLSRDEGQAPLSVDERLRGPPGGAVTQSFPARNLRENRSKQTVFTLESVATRTLIASFLHFDLSFMLWVLLGALGIYISESLGLNPFEKGLLVAVPVLTGSLLRIPLGMLGDRIGGQGIGTVMLAFLFVPLTLGWLMADSLPMLLATGLLLGTAGASFAVALPLASRWYPARRQGLVMGIAAAGNSGTVIANLAAPRLAEAVGWHNVLGLAMIPLAVVLVAFFLLAKDAPSLLREARATPSPLTVLSHGDLWWFCLFYSVTFGGYVGLSSFLPLFLRDQYTVGPTVAGSLTALGAFVGSGIRPLGGYLADRVGGTRSLSFLLISIALIYWLASQLPSLEGMAMLAVLGMGSLGLGNGAVFQLVPQRFRAEMGAATGMIGALGGLGGFFLPILLGAVRHGTGSFGPGFAILGLVALTAFIMLRVLALRREGWRFSWAQRQIAPAPVPIQDP